MKYNKGYTLKNGAQRMKILETLGDLYFPSLAWDSEENAIIASQMVASCCTEYQLDRRGWELCPPDETLLPKEAWKPKEGEKYWFAWINPAGEVAEHYDTFGGTWDRSVLINKYLAIGNVHKTKEEAIVWAKKRYNIS